jgi:hypothetical protein
MYDKERRIEILEGNDLFGLKGGLVRKCIVAHDPQQDLISGSDKYSVLEYFHQSAKCWSCPSTAETQPPPHVARTFTSIYLRSMAAPSRTTGYLLGFPVTLFLSTVLRALRG